MANCLHNTFRKGIGEVCSPRVGTMGYMPPETMSLETQLAGAAAQDVVAVAVTLLRVCLLDQFLTCNLFALQVRGLREQQ